MSRRNSDKAERRRDRRDFTKGIVAGADLGVEVSDIGFHISQERGGVMDWGPVGKEKRRVSMKPKLYRVLRRLEGGEDVERVLKEEEVSDEQIGRWLLENSDFRRKFLRIVEGQFWLGRMIKAQRERFGGEEGSGMSGLGPVELRRGQGSEQKAGRTEPGDAGERIHPSPWPSPQGEREEVRRVEGEPVHPEWSEEEGEALLRELDEAREEGDDKVTS